VIDEVRARADIVQLVSRYVTLRKQGPRHWGLCPFHSEKTPSFQVHEDRQIFYCFGCGAGGDLFGFRMRHDGLDFPDAVRAIAREVGVPIPQTEEAGSGRTGPIYEIHDAAVEYFRSVLRSREGSAAQSYLAARGVPEDLADRFQIGCAPPRWDGLCEHLTRGGFSLETAERGGLVAPRQDGRGHYDRFRGRLIFPIAEANGQTVGFGGRSLEDDTPKYLNSPESPIYRKGRVFFGLPQALDAIRRSGRVAVVEGYFDVIALHRAGIQEVVAPCGTAVTPEHARRLHRYVDQVILLFDGDEAGQRAAERSLPVLLAEGLRVRGAFLPAGDDPDSLIQSRGADALVKVVDEAEPLLDRLIEQTLRGASSHAWAAADAAQALAPYLQAVSDPIERGDYVRRVAMRLQVAVPVLEEALRRGRREDPADPPGAQTPPAERGSVAAPTAEVDSVSRTLLGALVAHPDLVPLIESRHLELLPPGPGRALVQTLSRCVRERAEFAISHLSSDQTPDLDPQLRPILVQIASQLDGADRVTAERAVRDCMAHLASGALQQEYRELAARIQESKDPVERDTLLEAMQQKLEQRRALTSSSP
jgi:DNA primase